MNLSEIYNVGFTATVNADMMVGKSDVSVSQHVCPFIHKKMQYEIVLHSKISVSQTSFKTKVKTSNAVCNQTIKKQGVQISTKHVVSAVIGINSIFRKS